MQNILWAGMIRKKNTCNSATTSQALSKAQELNLLGALTIKISGSNEVTIGTGAKGPRAILSLPDEDTLQQLLTGGSLAFAEAYLQSKWNSPNLTDLLEWCGYNQQALAPFIKKRMFPRLMARARHLTRPNSLRGSRINIAAHYDLGNTFYSHWLDPTMSYSAGHFERPNSTLEEAQFSKFDYIIDSLGLKEGHHLLDIGGGWGGFACYAATRIGCRVTVTTISKNQYDYIIRKVAQQKLGGLVRVLYSDYRRLSGSFDRISSIEMLEAVGERYWPQFANTINNLLTPNGRVFIQTIVINDIAFPSYRKNVDFIQKYIFPGGMLPSEEMLHHIFPKAEWLQSPLQHSNANYPNTLKQWSANFEKAWPKIQPLGFDNRFFRLWKYYLAYCEAGFRSGRLNLSQHIFERFSNGR